MLRYVCIRVLLIFPVFILISTIVYLLSTFSPGDRVKQYLDIYGTGYSADEKISDEDYMITAKKLNLDKPHFYFSIVPRYFPDTLHRIVIPDRKQLARMLLNETGSWSLVSEILNQTVELNKMKPDIHDDGSHGQINEKLAKIMDNASMEEFLLDIKSLENMAKKDSLSYISDFTSDISSLLGRARQEYFSKGAFIPKFVWNGTANRFHICFSKVIRFDFGVSMVDGRKVIEKLSESFPLTFTYVILAYLFSFLFAVPLGLFSASKSKSIIVRFADSVLSSVYSVPLFWLSTLAVVFLTTDEVSGALNIFPSIGIGYSEPDASLTDRLINAMPHFFLPALIVALYSAAYLSLLIRRNLEKEMSEVYFMSLLARGIPKKAVFLKHAFPNSMLSLITLVVMGFPAALAGSVVIEVVFNIPGMGRMLYDSLLRYDWNVVYTIVIFIGLLTYVFYIAGDVIYSLLNPKIRYK